MSNLEKIADLKESLILAEYTMDAAGNYDYVPSASEADYIIENLFDCDKDDLIKSLTIYEDKSYRRMEEIVDTIKEEIITLT